MALDPSRDYSINCVFTENTGRRRIAINSPPKAVELVNMRLQQSMGDLFHNRLVPARTDIPRHTDIEAPVPHRQNKHVLFGQQEGRFNECRGELPVLVLKVDCIISRDGGGQETSRTYSSCAPTVIVSRANGRRNAW